MANLLVPLLAQRFLVVERGLSLGVAQLLQSSLVLEDQVGRGMYALPVVSAAAWRDFCGKRLPEQDLVDRDGSVVAAGVPLGDSIAVVPQLLDDEPVLGWWVIDEGDRLSVVMADVDDVGTGGLVEQIRQIIAAPRSWLRRRGGTPRCQLAARPLRCDNNSCAPGCTKRHFIDPDLEIEMVGCRCGAQ